ncbi:MAG: NAD(P)(+) transhydrogenase (Re/Si-specific) subunit beta [Candidatus Hydrogenedentes bacterium]|nr:NAD(P)(+) transhydrogenase (Re/Si-specific) subunit beta [Candidatus Hydrogenedentota bacterium]
MSTFIELSYIISAVLFILGLKMLGNASTAVRGNSISASGMLLAVVVTLLHRDIVSYQLIIAGILVGGGIGAIAAVRVSMTSMPEFVALFNGTGGLASLMVGWAAYYGMAGDYGDLEIPRGDVVVQVVATFLSVLIGGVTFTGSLIAYAKLSEKIDGKPVLFTGQQWLNGLVLLSVVASGVIFVINPDAPAAEIAFYVTMGLAFVFGVLATIPIGGADMPVVISLLNSYSGLAACAAGFVIGNTVLIVSGSLVGASGIVLTNIMCKAMNRSLAHVLFSGFGSAGGSTQSGGEQGEAKSLTAEDAYYVLEAAASVVIVPGYGMAVAQAQHVVRELAELLEKNGAEVKYAVHPVAGRMPGHMNVLLAEADVPYEQLVEMDDINPTMETVDVCIVIGANDVVNPGARDDESSVIYGMPIINVDLARSVFVLKRSMASGFAGVQNPLFFKENTRMLFGDAKATVTQLVNEFKGA